VSPKRVNLKNVSVAPELPLVYTLLPPVSVLPFALKVLASITSIMAEAIQFECVFVPSHCFICALDKATWV